MTNTTMTPAERRQLNPMQRRAINRVIRFFRQTEAYSGCTSVRIRLNPTNYRVVWMHVTTRRSDCERYSPRALLCSWDAFIQIGKRGAIRVHSARHGLTPSEHHVARMVRGKTAK